MQIIMRDKYLKHQKKKKKKTLKRKKYSPCKKNQGVEDKKMVF